MHFALYNACHDDHLKDTAVCPALTSGVSGLPLSVPEHSDLIGECSAGQCSLRVLMFVNMCVCTVYIGVHIYVWEKSCFFSLLVYVHVINFI